MQAPADSGFIPACLVASRFSGANIHE